MPFLLKHRLSPNIIYVVYLIFLLNIFIAYANNSQYNGRGFRGDGMPAYLSHAIFADSAFSYLEKYHLLKTDIPMSKLRYDAIKPDFFARKSKTYLPNDENHNYFVQKFIKIQMEYLSEIIKDINVGYFYSSEEYGKYVAQYLDIKNVTVDKNRINCPIYAGMIRNDLEKYKNFVNLQVLNDLQRTIK